MKNCQVCLRDFIPAQGHEKRQLYCSAKCNGNASHRRKKKLSIRNLELICVVCENKFKQKRANNTEYCSYECKKLGVFRKWKGLPIKGAPKRYGKNGYITSTGYRMISRNHPNAKMRSPKTGKGQILEHTFVMSEYLGRPLKETETVHHKNGIRNDNRIENLELWCITEKAHHRFGQRVEDKLNWCKEFLEQYGHKVIMNEKTIT